MKTETITCQDCGTTFQWGNEYAPGDILHRMTELTKPTLCVECSAAEDLREKEAEDERFVNDAVNSARYHQDPVFKNTTETHHGFNKRAWARIKKWRPTEEKPWLGLIGQTGTSKSRIAHLLILEIVRDMALKELEKESCRKVHDTFYVSAYEINGAVTGQYSSCNEVKHESRKLLNRLRDTHVLMLDDIGKGKLTAAVASELFAVIDTRSRGLRTTIWTANSTPEQIAASLPAELQADMAGPFAGRLNDFSTIYSL